LIGTRTKLRDLGIALSLANLLFLKGWLELLEGVRHPYFRKEIIFYWYDTAALMLDVLLCFRCSGCLLVFYGSQCAPSAIPLVLA
jgi:hypothetical protein